MDSAILAETVGVAVGYVHARTTMPGVGVCIMYAVATLDDVRAKYAVVEAGCVRRIRDAIKRLQTHKNKRTSQTYTCFTAL